MLASGSHCSGSGGEAAADGGRPWGWCRSSTGGSSRYRPLHSSSARGGAQPSFDFSSTLFFLLLFKYSRTLTTIYLWKHLAYPCVMDWTLTSTGLGIGSGFEDWNDYLTSLTLSMVMASKPEEIW